MKKYLLTLVLVVVVGIAAFSFYKTSISEGPRPTFAGVSLTLDYATTKAERELGLGGRESIPSGYGMLFVFPRDERYGFWMKDTLVPLDMFWFDGKGRVVYIAPNVATTTYPHVFYPSVPARYVLETAAGFAEAHQVKLGAELRLKSFPTVSE